MPATVPLVPDGHAAETFRTHIDNALKALLPAPIS